MNHMKLYFAPMEGITTYTYRNTHKELFGGCDKYFTPFITPSANERVSIKSLRDIVPEKNADTPLEIQVMANDDSAFLNFEDKICELGYNSVNLNFGCPSSTVVKKNRGAGILRDLEQVDRFLYNIFEKSRIKISVKTRTGFENSLQFVSIMEIYNRYPITELIIHPRCREEYYKGEPNLKVFANGLNTANMPVCYNGNIFSVKDYGSITESLPKINAVMLGRGAVANPALLREIKGGKPLAASELIDFTKKLIPKYLEVLGSEVYTLHKLKEIWLYMMWNYPDEKKLLKAVKKSNRLTDLISAIECLPEIRRK